MRPRLGWLLAGMGMLMVLLGWRSWTTTPSRSRAAPLALTPPPTTAPALSILQITPAPEHPLPPQTTWHINFDRPLATLPPASGFVHLYPAQGEAVPLDVRQDGATLTITPRRPLARNETYLLVLDADLPGQEGGTLGIQRHFAYHTQRALEVVQAFPAADSTDVAPDSEITVVFDRPVVPLQAREDETPLPLQFEPAIPGQGRWVSTYIYTYTPAAPLQSGVVYTVTLPADAVTAQDGTTLAEPYRWTFQVTPLTAHAYVMDGRTDEAYLDTALFVQFSQPMRTTEVDAALRVRAITPGATVPAFDYQWDDDARGLMLVPQARFTAEAAYEMVLTAPVHAQNGGVLEATTLLTFRIAGPPRVVVTEPGAGEQASYAMTWAWMHFNVPLDEDSLAGRVHLRPQPDDFQWHLTGQGESLVIGLLEPARTYTVELDAGIRDVYGRAMPEGYAFTFTNGTPDPSLGLYYPAQPTLLPAQGPQRIWMSFVNMDELTVQVRRLPVEDFLAQTQRQADTACPDTGEVVLQATLDLAQEPRHTEVLRPLDLQALNDGQPLPPGPYCLNLYFRPEVYGRRQDALLLAVFSDRLVLKAGVGDALAWVTDPRTGQAQAQTSVALYTTDSPWPYAADAPVQELARGTTDAQGLAHWEGLERAPRYAVVEGPDRFGFVDLDWMPPGVDGLPGLSRVWQQHEVERKAVLYTDRPLYRPGQRVYFRGVLRDVDDLHYRLPEQVGPVYVWLYSEEGQVAEQRVGLSAWGTFDGGFALPEAAPPGYYMLEVGTLVPDPEDPDAPPDREIWGSFGFRVARYHKPVFRVELTPEAEVVTPDRPMSVTVQATYYAGDAVAHGQATWWVESRAATFVPPARYADYTFGFVRDDFPWGCWYCETQAAREAAQPRHTTTTDGQGRFTIQLDPQALLTPWDPRQDVEVLVRAAVTDVGGHTAEGDAAVQVVRSQVLIGLKTEGWLGQAGEPLTVHLVTLTPTGQPQPDQTVQVQVFREHWNTVRRRDADGRWGWESELELTPVDAPATVVTDAQGRATFTFTPPQGGLYRLVATTTDAQGREREAGMRVWAVGAEALLWPYTDTARLPLFPDQEAYEPGDTAQVLVPPPFTADGVALVTVERQGVRQAWLQPLTPGNTVLEVPIQADMAPGVYVTVTALKPPGETAAAYRVGTAYLPVNRTAQRLQVQVTPDREQAQPGDTVAFTIETRDAAGQPVAAEVSLALVDQALLHLLPDTFDLLEALYPRQPLSVATAVDVYADGTLMDERLTEAYEATGPGMGGGGGKGGDMLGVVTVRRNYRDTAYWRGRVYTGPDGRAVVRVSLPDNMTTWVMTARAITRDTRAGQATAQIRVQRPFFVRLHAPVFFTAGDAATIQAVLHNTTDTDLEATVRLSVQGARLDEAPETTTTVPARGQAAVRWTLHIPADGQRVDLTVAAQAGAYHDAAQPELTLLPDGGIPVYAYTLNEAVGTAGVLVGPGQETQIVRPPANAVTGQLRVTLNGSLVARLVAAYQVPAEPRTSCAWPWAMRVLGLAEGRRLWQTLAPATDPPVNWAAALEQGVQTLVQTQFYDGGWRVCPDTASGSVPDLSAWVLFALLEARDAGAEVPEDTLQQAAVFLDERLNGDWLARWPWQVDDAALAVLNLARLEVPHATQHWLTLRDEPRLSLVGKAWLLQAAVALQLDPTLRQDLRRALDNHLTFSATSAHWEGAAGATWGLGTDLGLTGLALDTVLQDRPGTMYLHHVVRWLTMYAPTRTPNALVQALVLRGLVRWAGQYDEAAPDFRYRVELNGQEVAAGRIAAQNRAQPLTFTWGLDTLQPAQDTPLTVARDAGPGTLYYTAGLTLTLPAEDLPARADGILVQRAYVFPEAPDTPIAAAPLGAIVQVRLTVDTRHTLRQVVLTDYLPAGLEPLDPALYPAYRPTRAFTWEDFWRHGWGLWYFEHRQVLDDRVVFVAPWLPRGTYTVVYYARAAVPGDFQVRPAEAFAAQEPDLRGRSAGTRFEVALPTGED